MKKIFFAVIFVLVIGGIFYFFQFRQESVNNSKERVYLDDSKIIDRTTGGEVKLRGVNLAQWFLLEGYLWGLNPKDGYQEYENIPQNELLNKLENILGEQMTVTQFWEEYENNFITDWDFEFIKSLGLNSVRIPIHYFMLNNENGIEALKSVIAQCDKWEIYCVLDMHAVPGAQSSYAPSDPVAGKVDFWSDELLRKEYFEDLGRLSDLSKKSEFVIGYDILNEPEVDNVKELRKFYREVVSFLRNRGDNKIIILQTNKVSTRVNEVYLGRLSNVMYSIHYYGFSKDVASDLESVYQFSIRKKVPIYVGEFGNWANDLWAKYSDRYILYTFEMYDFNYMYWPYKDLIPSNEVNDNNFGLFNGPQSDSWNEFFTALNTAEKLEAAFNFDELFESIRSDNQTLKEAVVELMRIPSSSVVTIPKIDDKDSPSVPHLQDDFVKDFNKCDGITFEECKIIWLKK